MPVFENAHALLIGIADYQLIHPPLPASVLNDVTDVRDILLDSAYCGYDPTRVHVLTNAAATRDAILTALDSLADQTNAESTVVLYISAHGGRIEAGPGAGEYLLPVETNVETTQALVDSAISSDEFTAALRKLRARKLLIILDCCFAGGIGQPKQANAAGLKSGFSADLYQALATGKGRVILAASRSDEESWTWKRNSLFTTHLLAGLRGGVPSDDGLIRIMDLFEYLQPRVTADKPTQHPVFRAELEENFPIALYVGGKKGVIPTDQEGYRHDAYISYVDSDPDSAWVWDQLVPRLTSAGLRVGVSGDVNEPGVDRITNMERGVTQAKRILLILSEAFLADRITHEERILAQTLGLQERSYRVIPIKMTSIEESRLPLSVSALDAVDLSNPRRAEREFERLIRALQGPLPRW
jgi:hypothetical protein